MVLTILVDVYDLLLKSSSTLAFWRNGVHNPRRRQRFVVEIELPARILENGVHNPRRRRQPGVKIELPARILEKWCS